jgi:hypothetical protein
MQAQAVINKLERESRVLREALIKKAKEEYVLSGKAKEIAEMIERRDKLKAEAESIAENIRKSAEDLGVTGVYLYSKSEEIIEKLINKGVEEKYPKIDLEAALDELIIKSVDDVIDIDGFIEHYLKQMRNG